MAKLHERPALWLIAYLFVIAGQAFDVLTTAFNLRNGAGEANGLAATLFGKGDFGLVIVVKLVLVGALALLVYGFAANARARRSWAGALAFAMTALLAMASWGIVANNLSVYVLLR